MQTYNVEGQMSMFAQDTWSGKTCQEPCPQTKEKTSAASSKKQPKSSKKIPLYLDLRRGGGLTQEPSWEMDGASLGVYTMHSFGEYPKEENASVLSQILVEEAHPKYSLSAKACRGILNRASKRGKMLPEILQKALEAQADV